MTLLFAIIAGVAFARPPGPLAEHELDLIDGGSDYSLDDELEDTGGMDTGGISCNTQRLAEGELLPEAPDFYKIWQPTRSWGRPELIEAITRASEDVAWRIPHADPVVVGDLSRRGGGPLSGHRSHRGGLDADLGLYWGEARQHLGGFRTVSPDELDAASTWAFIDALLDTGLVERILLDRGLILRLRRHVLENDVLTREEADRIMPVAPDYGMIWNSEGVIHHVPGHRHHLHLRVKCGS